MVNENPTMDIHTRARDSWLPMPALRSALKLMKATRATKLSRGWMDLKWHLIKHWHGKCSVRFVSWKSHISVIQKTPHLVEMLCMEKVCTQRNSTSYT